MVTTRQCTKAMESFKVNLGYWWPAKWPPRKNGGAGIDAMTPSPRHASSDLAGTLLA